MRGSVFSFPKEFTMSIKVMSRVWEHSQAKGSPLLLLLALADSADDDGFCWPGIDHQATKIRMHPNSVRNCHKTLAGLGELLVIPRDHRTHLYIVLTALPPEGFARSINRAKTFGVSNDDISTALEGLQSLDPPALEERLQSLEGGLQPIGGGATTHCSQSIIEPSGETAKETSKEQTDSDESVPPPPEHVDDIFPRTSEGKPLEPSNPLEVAARQRWGQRGEAWSVPESARSPTGWGDVVDEFAHLSGISPTDKVRGQWGKIFKDIADTWEVGPGVLVEVVRKIPESAALGWMQSWNPHNKSFQSSLGIMIGQHLDGGVVLDTRAEEAPQSRRDRIKDMIASGIAVG